MGPCMLESCVVHSFQCGSPRFIGMKRRQLKSIEMKHNADKPVLYEQRKPTFKNNSELLLKKMIKVMNPFESESTYSNKRIVLYNTALNHTAQMQQMTM